MIDLNSIDKNVPIPESRGLYEYFGSLKAVENADMKAMVGDIFGIIGPSDAGKTTLFSTCTGMCTPTKGKVYLMGEDVTGFSSEKVTRKRTVRMFQNLQLFKLMNVLDSTEIGCHTRIKNSILDVIIHTGTYKQDEEHAVSKSGEILKAIGLFGYRDTMAGNLAYDMRRRVEIAGTLAPEPYTFLLDEPVTDMNPLETQELMEFTKIFNEGGYTIAVIEHDMKFITNSCNRTLVLNPGQKIRKDTSDEVEINHQVQETYFRRGTIAGEAVKVHA